ncbi:MAG TPA: hypothetical protein VLJ16_14890 [Acidobacteriota bacterium]|nr:hypothetical protein [Acidobacteriota bacterium]
MALPVTAVLSAASLLLFMAASPAHPPQSISAAVDPKVVLTPEERALVLRGKIILRSHADPGLKGRTYEAIGLIQGSLAEAECVLVDFESYPDYMPNVAAIKVCERTGLMTVVETTLDLPLGMTKQYRLRYTAARDEDGFRLSWEMLPWPELKPSRTIADTSGFWRASEFDGGGLLVVHHVYTDPGHVPLGLTGIARGVAKHKVPDGIVKLRERIRDVFRPVSR